MKALTQQLIRTNSGAIIQDFIPDIAHRGELSCVYFDDYCYMYFRVGKGDEERVQFLYGGKSFHFTLDSFEEVKPKILQHKPSFDVTVDMISQCQQTANKARATLNKTLNEQGLKPPRCVRIDGVITSTGHFLLMEAEMIEPYWEFEAAGKANHAQTMLPLAAFVQTVEDQYYSTYPKSSPTFA